MKRSVVVTVVLAALLGAALVAGLAFGSVSIPIERTLRVLTGSLDAPMERSILMEVRMPRVLIGLFVGGGLALAGALLQGLFRNPMADPGVIGVSSGGALGAVLAIHTGLSAAHTLALPAMAFAGSFLALLSVYRLSTRAGRTPMSTLLLSGIAVGALAGALTSLFLTLALANYTIGRQMIYWLLGGLDARNWLHVKTAVPVIAAACAAALLYSRSLDVLSLGEESASTLGVSVQRTRIILILLAAVLTGTAVAVSGVIGFVGLVVPHVVRLLIGPAHRMLLPASFLAGAILLVGADLLARTLVKTEEVRLGVITAVLGAPFFLYLLVQSRRKVEVSV